MSDSEIRASPARKRPLLPDWNVQKSKTRLCWMRWHRWTAWHQVRKGELEAKCCPHCSLVKFRVAPALSAMGSIASRSGAMEKIRELVG